LSDLMTARTWIPAAILLAVIAGTTAGWMWTREAPLPAHGQEGQVTQPNQPRTSLRRAALVQERLVDQTPLLTARSLVPLATTFEEKQLALQAERLGNHSVDLAFTFALHSAATASAPKTPELKKLTEVKAKAVAAVEAGEQEVARLNRQLGATPESRRDSLESQIEITRAQLELDKDELETASDDMARAGGDPQAKIRRLKEAHEAADRESSQAMAAARPPNAFQAGSLIGRVLEWRLQRDKYGRLATAQLEAQTKEQALTKRRAEIEAQAKKEKEDREAARSTASTLMRGASGRKLDREEAKAAVVSLKQFGDVERRLSTMARRIQDQHALGETYGSWLALADGYRNVALHALLTQGLAILGVVLAVYLFGLVIDWRFHHSASAARLSAGASKSVMKVIIRVLAVLVIGFLIVGMPAQATTIFGLAGAGLTVALKDFIVAFFGWFILMGKNGIRLGDWVEIRGVGGEVVEIGLLRTVILETGSWSDAGHPTGRRVSFVNNFAIEGHFFNFSTSGKWMWDELNIVVPTGQDPYLVIDGVQKLVEQQTGANAKVAEAEWQQTAARYRVKAFSAVPGVQVSAGPNGMEVRARYLTRAFERHETRLRLNQAVVELMHGPRGDGGAIAKVEAG
jgi:small-conductance mechanosensitive channel